MRSNSKHKFTFLLESTSTYVPQLLIIAFLLVLSSIAALSMPWLAGQLAESLIDSSSSKFNRSTIFFFLAVAILLQALAMFGSGYLSDRTGEEVLINLRIKIFSKLQSATLNLYDQYNPGQLLSLITNDAEIISDFLTRTSIGIFPQILTFSGAITALCVINFKLGIACILISILFVFFVKILGKSIRPTSALLMRKYGELIEQLDENIKLISVIKAFSLERSQTNLFSRKNQEYLNISKKYFIQQNTISPSVQCTAGLLVLCGVWLLMIEVKQDNLTISELVSILLYGVLVTRPLTSLGAIYGRSQMFLAAVSRISDLLDEASEKPPSNAIQNTKDNSVSFEKVSFNYPNRPSALVNFDLQINHGETVSIVGSNGSGKSTIAKLLLGFLKPATGTIYIGKVNQNQLDHHTIRNKIAYVPQDTKLFNNTIRKNIQLTDDNLPDSSINTVLELVGANDLLADLPEGLDTIIGDMGTWLSGGQRQKIALARAVIKKPGILILDEATSMFDPDSEEQFIKNCQTYLDKTTIINITHRPASLEASDRVIRMQ